MLTCLFLHSPRRSTPSTVSARRATRARASSRAPPLRSHKWARCPIAIEQESDIGVEQGIAISHAHPDPEIVSLGHELHAAGHAAVNITADGCPVDTDLRCSLFFVLWPTSIRKCVYPVLCYSQCISFVAIEKYVGWSSSFCYTMFLVFFFSRSTEYFAQNSQVSAYVIVGYTSGRWSRLHWVRLFPERFGTCSSWCGEPLSKRTARTQCHCECNMAKYGHFGQEKRPNTILWVIVLEYCVYLLLGLDSFWLACWGSSNSYRFHTTDLGRAVEASELHVRDFPS